MKSFLLAALLGFSSVCVATTVNAQQKNAPVGCMDAAIRSQAQGIKQHFLNQGFEVYRDAMISMSSNQPFPVIIELKKGEFYQIIFVGNSMDSKIKLELFDGNDKKIVEKQVMREKNDLNYISYSFTPEQTDAYMFMLMQKQKNKEMCGSFTILKLKSADKASEVKQFEGK